MPHREDIPLFDHDALLTDEDLAAEAAEALAPGAGERRPDLDAARLWRSGDDGLLVRGVKPHSAEKSRLVSRGIDTVSSAMAGEWFTRRHGLEFVELYSGPGRLLNARTGEEQPGSPMEALAVRKPFSRYVFSDLSEECVTALAARVGNRRNVDVIQGDANDPAHIKCVAALLNPSALVIAYLDPARPQDLRWSTVEYLARTFGSIDLIINLPVNSLMRAILGAYHGGGSGPGAAGLFLNHASPDKLLLPGPIARACP